MSLYCAHVALDIVPNKDHLAVLYKVVWDAVLLERYAGTGLRLRSSIIFRGPEDEAFLRFRIPQRTMFLFFADTEKL